MSDTSLLQGYSSFGCSFVLGLASSHQRFVLRLRVFEELQVLWSAFISGFNPKLSHLVNLCIEPLKGLALNVKPFRWRRLRRRIGLAPGKNERRKSENATQHVSV